MKIKEIEMAKHSIELKATEGMFRGLAKQNMLFHQCISELVDNAISATLPNKKFAINIIFHQSEGSSNVQLYIADAGRGMPLHIFQKAIQIGESATTESRLNEHGYGLKNALATLSSATNKWKIWTKDFEQNKILSVESPFKSVMQIDDDDEFPNYDFLPADFSTLIFVEVKYTYLQTVQGRGARTTDLEKIRLWLIEHLGVFYRGYLEQNFNTGENDGSIKISIDNDTLQVLAVPVPTGKREVKYINVKIGSQIHKLTYNYGALDEERRDTLVRGEKAKFYYQGNRSTQGIDIRLGKRTIAVQQLEHIWLTEDKQKPIMRHNDYNDFVGELLIPELPRGVLTTVNNKTDFNLDDEEWQKIFDQLREIKPIKKIREKNETDLRKKWMEMLKATNPEEEIVDHISVWFSGVKIDVYRKTSTGAIIIYELKVGTAAPLHLYQLKMYWDGLVLKGEQPKEAILLVEDFLPTHEQMANEMNNLTPPLNSKPYNFKLEKISNKGL